MNEGQTKLYNKLQEGIDLWQSALKELVKGAQTEATTVAEVVAEQREPQHLDVYEDSYQCKYALLKHEGWSGSEEYSWMSICDGEITAIGRTLAEIKSNIAGDRLIGTLKLTTEPLTEATR